MTIYVWDKTKPATGGNLVSADIRNMWGATESALFGVNLVADPIFELWAGGDSVAPTWWTYIAGAGGTIARAGTGLADTAVDANSVKPVGSAAGAWCPKLVYGSASQRLRQMLLGATGVTYFKNEPFSAGMWVRATAASGGRISLNDGIANSHSSYHTGDGTWQWLTCTMASGINSAATGLWIQGFNDAGTVYLSAPTVVRGSVPPPYFMPSPVVKGAISPGTVQGNLVVGNVVNGFRNELGLPAIMRSTRLRAGTAPATTAIIVRPQKNGASSVYSTNPQIAAAASSGNRVPEGTYANRCFAKGDYLTFDITQVGTGTTGADLSIAAVLEQYARPFQPMLSDSEEVG